MGGCVSFEKRFEVVMEVEEVMDVDKIDVHFVGGAVMKQTVYQYDYIYSDSVVILFIVTNNDDTIYSNK